MRLQFRNIYQFQIESTKNFNFRQHPSVPRRRLHHLSDTGNLLHTESGGPGTLYPVHPLQSVSMVAFILLAPALSEPQPVHSLSFRSDRFLIAVSSTVEKKTHLAFSSFPVGSSIAFHYV